MKATIDVCIATFKRPELLKRLLLSLNLQETSGLFSFSVIVADNDAERSAEPVAEELTGRSQKIIYAVEPLQNISLARNKSISLATADFIATIDDDTYPDTQWLLNLYRTITSYDADVVHGPVVPEFLPGVPAYITECQVFNRPNPITGSTDKYVFTTANSLFRRALVVGRPIPFDPRFGKTGGEDTAFFSDLKKCGHKMIWCREALVIGPVSPLRTNLQWVLKRSFQYGITSRCAKGFPKTKHGMVSTCKKVIILSCFIVLDTLRAIFHPKNRDKGITPLMNNLLEIAFQLGILAHYGNFRFEQYRSV